MDSVKKASLIPIVILSLLCIPIFSSAQLSLVNTCNISSDTILLTDADNYFKIEGWPDKALMRLECNSCKIDFKTTGGIFELTPSENGKDTLEVYKEDVLIKVFQLSHALSGDLQVFLVAGKNKTVGREEITANSELVVKSGKPGCRTRWKITEFDVLFPAGTVVHCNGDHFSPEALKKLISLDAGMQFNIENTKAVLKDQKEKVFSTSTYFLKD